MNIFKKKKNKPLHMFSELSSAIGKGLIAGAAGTVAITISQMIEMKITKRPASEEPADAAEKVLHITPDTSEDKKKLSQDIHWLYGSSWGVPRGLLSLAGLNGLSATGLHFATIYATSLIMPPALKIAPPLKEWKTKELLINALHHGVYALAAGLVYEALKNED